MKQAQNPSVAENHLGGVAAVRPPAPSLRSWLRRAGQNGSFAVLANRHYTQSISMIPRGVAAVRENGTPASRSGSARRYSRRPNGVGRVAAALCCRVCPIIPGPLLVGMALLLAAPFARAVTVTWLPATGTNDWFDTNNWSTLSVPTNNDDVIITNTIAGNNFGVLLTNSTAALASILLSNKCTLIFSNWDTYLSATNVSILSNGRLTCVGGFTNTAMSNRVRVICSNLSIAAGGSINADGQGYAGGFSASYTNGQGPGGGLGATVGAGGAGYGGYGSPGYSMAGGVAYESTNAPLSPGSGGGSAAGWFTLKRRTRSPWMG